ncbi:INPP5J [Cordylochernes scorpioides]|uniref:INPP5J n=1 Tax=Cordylochernes scorpioides TaxID=51811 RepID=A0ABY6K3X2_9ARAC|nr:INPP5J [Cordylochernes scorpioides]
MRMLKDFRLQEVSVKPQDLIVDILFTDPWLHQYKHVLHRWNYVRFRYVRLQGIMIMAFCKRQHLTHLRGIQTDYTRTGFGGMWGNKGGTSLRFSVYGCSVCVVNSHLASGDDFVKQRIEDYNSIMEKQKFIDPQTRSILSHE